MNPIKQYSQIQIAAKYSTYIIDKDNVVIFYNAEHPLLLQGIEAVKLVKNITSPDSQSRVIEEALIPTLAKLLMDGFIVYHLTDV